MANGFPSPPFGPHGVLGHWAVVGHGFGIASIISSFFVIIAVGIACWRNRLYYNRPSFRLSAWIAACDIIYTVCQVCTFDNPLMTSLPMINLRAINWMMKGSVLSFILLSVCLGIHLIMTVVLRKKHLADCIQHWYEPVSLVLGFLITHPIMYLYKGVQWNNKTQGFHFIEDPVVFKRNSWLILWGWVLAGVIFLVIVSFMVYVVMLSTFRGTIQYMQMPEGDDKLETLTTSTLSKERKRLIRSVTMRISMYPAVPIVTQGWVIAANMVTTLPYWLYVVASLMPALQGVLNFLVFLFNPAWDGQRKILIDPFLKRVEKRRNKRKQPDLESETIEMLTYHTNDSTIKLSPYQSRN